MAFALAVVIIVITVEVWLPIAGLLAFFKLVVTLVAGPLRFTQRLVQSKIHQFIRVTPLTPQPLHTAL